MKFTRMDTERLIYEFDQTLENLHILKKFLYKRGIDVRDDIEKEYKELMKGDAE